jgi:hypothetical protein
MFIINVINACSRVYRTHDIRGNLRLDFVVKVVAGLRRWGWPITAMQTNHTPKLTFVRSSTQILEHSHLDKPPSLSSGVLMLLFQNMSQS